jgi:hypothetical protein
VLGSEPVVVLEELSDGEVVDMEASGTECRTLRMVIVLSRDYRLCRQKSAGISS